MCLGSRAPHFRTVLQNWQDKSPKASPKKRLITEHSPGLPQDTKFLRNYSGNQAKMLLKCHLGRKFHSKYNKVIRLLQCSSSHSYGGDWECIVCGQETIIILVLLAFNYIPQRSHHSLTLPRSRIRDSATVTMTPGDFTKTIKVVGR